MIKMKQETLEEVIGSSMCEFSVIENKLAILYRNQVKIYDAINNQQAERMYSEEDLISFYDFIENHQLRKYGNIWKRITNDPNVRPLNFESVDDKYIIEWFKESKKNETRHN
jgi:hypothetical protein